MIPAAQPIIGDEERAAVDRVMQSGMLAQGPEVAAFEEEFSEQVVVDGRRTTRSDLWAPARVIAPGHSAQDLLQTRHNEVFSVGD